MPAPDPIGKKRSAQRSKVYYGDTTDPLTLSSWTEDTAVRLESMHIKTGADPSTAVLVEWKRTTAPKSIAAPPAYETVTIGSGGTGSLPKGTHLTEGTLVKIEIEDRATASTYRLAFMGVVTRVDYDLRTANMVFHCEDYRYFMRKTPIYGRYAWCVIGEDEFGLDYIRPCRCTFNEDGQPDRAQMGETFGGEGTYDGGAFTKPRSNRNDATEAGAPVVEGNYWAEFWTLGHIWNYLRSMYSVASPPTDIAHLSCYSFIDWPECTTGSELALSRLFNDLDGNKCIPLDLALTGMNLADAIDALLKRCSTPLEWTLVPAADNKSDIVVFSVRDGRGQFDLEMAAPGETVYTAAPVVKAGRISRDGEHRFNRAYGIGRRHVYEVTLSTVDGTLVNNYSSTDQAAYIADVTNEEATDDTYPRVFLSWRAPENLDWEAEFFGTGVKTAYVRRPTLKQLLTWATNGTDSEGLAGNRVRLYPQVWRSKDGGTNWQRMPQEISVTILDDICGFKLTSNARREKKEDGEASDWDAGEPWTWDGDTGTPARYDIRITLAVEADECIAYEYDLAEGGKQMEYFLDGGNAYRNAYHSSAFLPTDGSGVPVIDNPVGDSELGSPASPDKFISDDTKLQNAVKQRLEVRKVANIGGTLVLTGFDVNPIRIGYQVGTITGGDNRPDIDVGSCVRSITYDRDADETTYTLDVK